MTLLEIALTVPAKDGTLTPANGMMRFTPTRRRHEGGVVVLPVPFAEPLTLGIVAVELEPTTPEWVWRIDEHVSGSPSRTIYATIPDAPSILYTDLVSIDPKTLAPNAEPAPAWTVALAETDTRLSQGTITPDPDDPGFFLIGAS